MYCLKGKTASGEKVREGIIAADPKILPLGSRVKIVSKTINGIFIVKDTGKHIKGKRIDIWVKDRKVAVNFGKQFVKLTNL